VHFLPPMLEYDRMFPSCDRVDRTRRRSHRAGRRAQSDRPDAAVAPRFLDRDGEGNPGRGGPDDGFHRSDDRDENLHLAADRELLCDSFRRRRIALAAGSANPSHRVLEHALRDLSFVRNRLCRPPDGAVSSAVARDRRRFLVAGSECDAVSDRNHVPNGQFRRTPSSAMRFWFGGGWSSVRAHAGAHSSTVSDRVARLTGSFRATTVVTALLARRARSLHSCGRLTGCTGTSLRTVTGSRGASWTTTRALSKGDLAGHW
jgi:hypothetical protein